MAYALYRTLNVYNVVCVATAERRCALIVTFVYELNQHRNMIEVVPVCWYILSRTLRHICIQFCSNLCAFFHHRGPKHVDSYSIASIKFSVNLINVNAWWACLCVRMRNWLEEIRSGKQMGSWRGVESNTLSLTVCHSAGGFVNRNSTLEIFFLLSCFLLDQIFLSCLFKILICNINNQVPIIKKNEHIMHTVVRNEMVQSFIHEQPTVIRCCLNLFEANKQV